MTNAHDIFWRNLKVTIQNDRCWLSVQNHNNQKVYQNKTKNKLTDWQFRWTFWLFIWFIAAKLINLFKYIVNSSSFFVFSKRIRKENWCCLWMEFLNKFCQSGRKIFFLIVDVFKGIQNIKIWIQFPICLIKTIGEGILNCIHRWI